MLEHGGKLRAAAQHYGIALADWIDLSTGINPYGYPIPPIDPACWQRLPEDDDGLEDAAAAYYGNERLLVLPGSQAAIQILPVLSAPIAVACLTPIYEELPQAWQRAGHRLRRLPTLQRALSAATPNVLLCNPNNPTALTLPRSALLDAGKFFGLAGARVGFIFGVAEKLDRLREAIGPWPVSHPARAVARQALEDSAWQAETRTRLAVSSRRLADLLAPLGAVSRTALFCTLSMPDNATQLSALHEHLARRAILTRCFDQHALLRFGLPGSEEQWQRLTTVIAEWNPSC